MKCHVFYGSLCNNNDNDQQPLASSDYSIELDYVNSYKNLL